MIEALAARIPVVAPDVGVAKEAGAIIADRDKLAERVIEVLKNPPQAHLKLPVLTGDEWVQAWKDSLI